MQELFEQLRKIIGTTALASFELNYEDQGGDVTAWKQDGVARDQFMRFVAVALGQTIMECMQAGVAGIALANSVTTINANTVAVWMLQYYGKQPIDQAYRDAYDASHDLAGLQEKMNQVINEARASEPKPRRRRARKTA